MSMTPPIEEHQPTTSTLDDSEEDLLAAVVTRTDEEIEAREDEVKKWMWNQLTYPKSGYIGAGQEVQCTLLAEDAAARFSLYYDEIECKIPDVVFDWAFDVASTYESRRDNDGEDS